ncbi:unnamed protein product [Discosporangium mesarthrocarpum]
MPRLDPSDPDWVCGWLLSVSFTLGLHGVACIGKFIIAEDLRKRGLSKRKRREVVANWINLVVTTTISITLTLHAPRVVILSRVGEAFSRHELEAVFLSFQLVAQFLTFELAFRNLHMATILHHIAKLAIILVCGFMFAETGEHSVAYVALALYSLLLSQPISVARLLQLYEQGQVWKWLRLASISNTVVHVVSFIGLLIFVVKASSLQAHVGISGEVFPWKKLMMWFVPSTGAIALACGLYESALLWEAGRLDKAKDPPSLPLTLPPPPLPSPNDSIIPDRDWDRKGNDWGGASYACDSLETGSDISSCSSGDSRDEKKVVTETDSGGETTSSGDIFPGDGHSTWSGKCVRFFEPEIAPEDSNLRDSDGDGESVRTLIHSYSCNEGSSRDIHERCHSGGIGKSVDQDCSSPEGNFAEVEGCQRQRNVKKSGGMTEKEVFPDFLDMPPSAKSFLSMVCQELASILDSPVGGEMKSDGVEMASPWSTMEEEVHLDINKSQEMDEGSVDGRGDENMSGEGEGEGEAGCSNESLGSEVSEEQEAVV